MRKNAWHYSKATFFIAVFAASVTAQPALIQSPKEKDLDLVSILIKFGDLTSTELPVEKFERYFKTKVVWTSNQATGFPASYRGSAPAYGIMAAGSNNINSAISWQGILLDFPRTGKCVLLKDLIKHLPQLKLHMHGGPAIVREDDPTQWEFYKTYTIERGASYIAYRFAFGINSDRIQTEDKQCLREVSSSIYLR